MFQLSHSIFSNVRLQPIRYTKLLYTRSIVKPLRPTNFLLAFIIRNLNFEREMRSQNSGFKGQKVRHVAAKP